MNTRDIRRRIKSVKNTSQITKAMQMVSATKMRRAQNQALSGRPYNEVLSSVLSRVSGKIDPMSHPLFQKNESKKVGVLLLSTDKGLCGALNANLFRTLQSSSEISGKEVIFYTIGKKGRDFIVRSHKSLEADFENSDQVSSSQAATLRKFLVEAFSKGELGEVYLLYADFVSTLKQEPKLAALLPLTVSFEEAKTNGREFLFEPDVFTVLDFALNHFVETQIYQALLETKASEYSARMVAMQAATDNAKGLVDDLTLSYNQLRQSAITNELLEITTAAAAME